MEDLKRAFTAESDNSDMTLHKENKHGPPRPEKVPFDNKDAGAISVDKMKKHYGGRIDRRHTHDSMAIDGVDDAITGADKFHRPKIQRPSTSQDDMDVMRRTSSKSEDNEILRLCREVESLRRKLKTETERANKAEAERDVMKETLESSFNEVAKGNDSLAKTIEGLQDDSKRLTAELEDARSHIFSLQPYRKDLTPEEVRRDFDDLVNSISEWAEKLMTPILDDETLFSDIATSARKRPSDFSKLKKTMHQHGDLVHGCMFPETDVDIMIAITMRFVHDHIFQKILYGAIPSFIETLTFVEGSMQTNVEPKRDLFTLRNWQAEAYNAIICSPPFRSERDKYMRRLTKELADVFKGFVSDKNWNSMCIGFQDNVIRPAMKLHEKLITSTHHFYLDLNPYIFWNSKQELETSSEFFENLKSLDCENILQNRKTFNVAKLDPKPTKEDLYHNLSNVVTLVPGLYMRQIGRADAIKDPSLVRKQQMLVSWGSPEKREKFVSNSQRTLMSHIYFAKGDRPERTLEAWATVWKWG